MNILCIDSHSCSGSVAIAQAGKIKFLSYIDITGTHSSRLMKMIDQALQSCQLTAKELDQIVLSVGPGSFTGIRIGVATAKGLAFAHNIPIVPVCSLELRALVFAHTQQKIISFCDAKTNEIYAAVYDQDLSPIIQPGCYPIPAFFGNLSGSYTITGDHYEIVLKHSQHLELTYASPSQSLPLASYLLQKSDSKASFDFQTLANLQPTYLRKSQAEIVWERNNKKQ